MKEQVKTRKVPVGQQSGLILEAVKLQTDGRYNDGDGKVSKLIEKAGKNADAFLKRVTARN